MQDSTQDAKNLIGGRYGNLYANADKFAKLIQDILKAYEKKNLVSLSNLLLH